MAAYVAGEARAFAVLFERYGPRLLRVMSRGVSRGSDVQDLVQQTFLQLHRARHDFRPGAKLRPWLFTIALNLKRQYFRRAGRRSEASLAQENIPEPVAATGDPERDLAGARVRKALGGLPEAQREVIALHWFEGLSFREIAEAVGASVSAVKVRAHRGYEKLRRALATSSEDVRTKGGVTESRGRA